MIGWCNVFFSAQRAAVTPSSPNKTLRDLRINHVINYPLDGVSQFSGCLSRKPAKGISLWLVGWFVGWLVGFLLVCLHGLFLLVLLLMVFFIYVGRH